MAWLYVLQSESSGRYYVGSTGDLSRRLSEHDRHHSLATRGRGPWKLVHQEQFGTLLEARRRERQVKAWKSSKMIANLIAEAVG